MKLLRYGEPGSEKPGILDASGNIRDLSGVIADISGATLAPQSLAKLAALDPGALPKVPGAPRLGPCVGKIGKMVCIGLNYADHAAEAGKPVPPEPMIFMKATSCIVGPNDDVEIPRGSQKTDWEVELAIVIGARAKYVSETDAPNYIAGYCVVNDISERDFQSNRQGQFTKGKSCDTFGPVGPWMVTPDEIDDVHSLGMFTEVDGKRYQSGSTSNLVFKVPFIVSYLSQFFTLHPGDVIPTGTPAGVGLGQKPQVFLKPGQTMRVGIEGLGEQRQKTVQG